MVIGKRAYRDRWGKQLFRPVLARPSDIWELDTTGWCLSCGMEFDGVEPDALYECSECNRETLFGFERLAADGMVDFGMEAA